MKRKKNTLINRSRMIKPLLTVLIGVSFLTACETVNSNPCPTLFVYSKERQNIIADELQHCLASDKPCNSVTDIIIDYHVIREQIRACNGHSN